LATTAAQLIGEVSITGADKAKSDLQSVSDSTNTAGSTFKSALGGALSLATGVAGQAFGFLKDQMVDSVKIAMAHQGVMAQTAQAIKSTGDVSGMTAQSIGNLSESLSKTTDFTEDTIQSGENLMLTFTGIGQKTFPAATTAMLDLSQATGQDMKSSALQLGKALNDPLTGMTALSRVGVSFSDAEKTSIKTMMAHNDVAGAQAVMLKELNTEFGGSAVAAGKTFAGALQILKNNLEDVKEKIGAAVLPILSKLMDFVTGVLMPGIGKAVAFVQGVLSSVDLSDFQQAWQAVGVVVQQVGVAFGKLTGALGPVAGNLKPLADTIRGLAQGGLNVLSGLLWDISGAFDDVMRSVQTGKGPFSDIGTIFKAIGEGARTLFGAFTNLSPAGNLFDALSRHAQDLGKWFQASVVPALKQAEPGFAALGHAIATLLPVFANIAEVVHTTFQKAFDALLPVFERFIPLVIVLAGQIAGGLGAAIQFLEPYVMQAVAAIGKFVDEIIQRVVPIMNQWITGIQSFLKIWNAAWPVLAPILKGVWDEIVGIVKIAWAIVSGLFKVALDLMSGNWSQAWKDLVDMLGGVWDGIKTYISGGLEIINGLFGGLPGKALQWGKDMISGFINGIGQMLGGLSNMAGNIASTISSHLHFSKPDIGPLADADQWMPDMMTLLAKGMNDNLSKIKTASLSVATSISTGASSPLAGGLQAIPQSVSQAGPIQITVQAPDVYMDGRLMSRALQPHLVQSVRSTSGVKF
jgi:phage-related protein